MSTASLSLNSRLAPMSMKAFMFLSRNDPFVVARHEVHESARRRKRLASDTECLKCAAHAFSVARIKRDDQIRIGRDFHHSFGLLIERRRNSIRLREDRQESGQGRVAV